MVFFFNTFPKQPCNRNASHFPWKQKVAFCLYWCFMKNVSTWYFAGEFTYWSRTVIPPNPTFIVNTVPFQEPRRIYAHEASAVSASGYALLVYLANNRVEEATSIMKWLQTMRNTIGGWGSTQVRTVNLMLSSPSFPFFLSLIISFFLSLSCLSLSRPSHSSFSFLSFSLSLSQISFFLLSRSLCLFEAVRELRTCLQFRSDETWSIFEVYAIFMQ